MNSSHLNHSIHITTTIIHDFVSCRLRSSTLIFIAQVNSERSHKVYNFTFHFMAQLTQLRSFFLPDEAKTRQTLRSSSTYYTHHHPLSRQTYTIHGTTKVFSSSSAFIHTFHYGTWHPFGRNDDATTMTTFGKKFTWIAVNDERVSETTTIIHVDIHTTTTTNGPPFVQQMHPRRKSFTINSEIPFRCFSFGIIVPILSSHPPFVDEMSFQSFTLRSKFASGRIYLDTETLQMVTFL